MPSPSFFEITQSAPAYSGIYRAFVRDVDDPDKLGRVRCYCPAVMGTDSDNEDGWLGWAPVSLAFASDNTDGSDIGMVLVPSVGTAVWIRFESSSSGTDWTNAIDFPVVVGTIVTGEDSDTSSLPKLGRGESDGDTDGDDRTADAITVPKSSAGTPGYPRNKIIKTANGTILEIDESSDNNRIRIRHPSGSFDEWVHSGNFVKQVMGDLLMWVGGKIKFRSVGDAMISVGGTLFLAGSDSSATKKLAHEDSQTEDHDHSVIFALTAPPSGGAVSGTITVQTKTNLKLKSSSCTPKAKVKP